MSTALGALALCIHVPPDAGIVIAGPDKVLEHSLVKLSCSGHKPKDGVVWRVTPRAHVSRADTAPHVLQFTAPPGEYMVDLLVISSNPDGQLTVAERSLAVTVEKKGPPPTAPAPKADASSEDPGKAICRISTSGKGCTGAVIGPRRTDGRWDILSAAHCTDKIGERSKVQLSDGRVITATVAVRDATSDLCWMVTDEPVADVSFALLATADPKVGSNVWHGGFGVDQPGNTEQGYVEMAENPNGQIQFRLSVSHGDSGGPIFGSGHYRVLAAVCCTTAPGKVASVWGGSWRAATRLRPVPKTTSPKSPAAEKPAGDDPFPWTPVTMPTLPTIPGERAVK